MRARSKVWKVANCTPPHQLNLSITGPLSKKRAILRRKVTKEDLQPMCMKHRYQALNKSGIAAGVGDEDFKTLARFLGH